MSGGGGYLVYTAGTRGPELRKWPEMVLGVKGKPCPHLSARFVPAAVFALPLADLVQLYPPPSTETKAQS